MEKFMKIGDPNIPSHKSLENKNNTSSYVLIGLVLLSIIVIYKISEIKNDEKQDSEETT